jgi:hypothetical protein
MAPPKPGEKDERDERDTVPPATVPAELADRGADAAAVQLADDAVEALVVPESGIALPPTKPVSAAAATATSRPTLRPAEALAAEAAARGVDGDLEELADGWAAPEPSKDG